MRDRQDFFADYQKRLTWNAREARMAVLYDAMPDCDVYWYLADAQDGKGYALCAAHDVIPVSKLDEEAPILEARHGRFARVGLTYEFPPFFVGVKSEGGLSRIESETIQRSLMTRENYKTMYFNQVMMAMNDPDMMSPDYLKELCNDPDKYDVFVTTIEKEVNGKIDAMSDDAFGRLVDDKVRNRPRELHPISRKTAERRAAAFLASDPTGDAFVISSAASEMNAFARAMKKLNFNV